MTRAVLPFRSTVIGAIFVFVLLMGLFYAFVHSPITGPDFFVPHLKNLAVVTGALLEVLGFETTVTGTTIHTSQMSIEIVRGCDAIEPAAVFAAAVIATPVALWTKLPGILAGVAVILAVNFIRIISLFYIAIHYPSAFETVHETVWQVAFIGLSIMLWALWAAWADRRGERHAHRSVEPSTAKAAGSRLCG